MSSNKGLSGFTSNTLLIIKHCLDGEECGAHGKQAMVHEAQAEPSIPLPCRYYYLLDKWLFK